MLSSADEQRLLLSEPALNAFIVAEMQFFCEASIASMDDEGTLAEKMRRDDEMEGSEAVRHVCLATKAAFTKLHDTGSLSDLSLIHI